MAILCYRQSKVVMLVIIITIINKEFILKQIWTTKIKQEILYYRINNSHYFNIVSKNQEAKAWITWFKVVIFPIIQICVTLIFQQVAIIRIKLKNRITMSRLTSKKLQNMILTIILIIIVMLNSISIEHMKINLKI